MMGRRQDLFARMFERRRDNRASRYPHIPVHTLGSVLSEYASGDSTRTEIEKRLVLKGRDRVDFASICDAIDGLTGDAAKLARAQRIEMAAIVEEESPQPSRRRFRRALGL